ncbi:hypothetical protein FD723_39930 (plasmid) [Nostoc sp. C052]|uniref:hypothetical protein n=1 Tax=Nostoc sp. C052 TaxID=2576902 RepID=UPI0015C3B84D|nr:hypothetical protein [Nostoc sp. C052]QLE46383.1 hypothetical protein FD723_39930 [Nostoc sp. C052]
MESKARPIYLHVSAEKPYSYESCPKRVSYYAHIEIRVATMSEEGKIRFVYDYYGEFPENQFYENLKLGGSVTNEAVLMDNLHPSVSLSYDMRYASEITVSICQKMHKTMQRIQPKLDATKRIEDSTYLDVIERFGKTIKAEKIAIDGELFDFPGDISKIQEFFLKTMVACYERAESAPQILRFTDADSSLDLPSTLRLEYIFFNKYPVIIEAKDLGQQALAYKHKDGYCLSEMEFRHREPVTGIPHLLYINRRRERKVEERLSKFYSENDVTNESGWRTYDKTFIRKVTIKRSYDESCTIYVKFEDFHDEDSEIIDIWTDRSNITIE